MVADGFLKEIEMFAVQINTSPPISDSEISERTADEKGPSFSDQQEAF